MPDDTTSEDDELIEITSAQPSPYVPSRDLELHRLLAEVGALVAPSPGGTLFCQSIPVRFRDLSADCDIERQIVVRVAVQDGRTLLIELYDDQEPLSLLRKEINVDDFELIRQEQQLLVDFTSFPQTIVQLLHNCCQVDQGLHLVALLVFDETSDNKKGLSSRKLTVDEGPRAEFHRWSLQGQSLPAIHELPIGSGVRRHYTTDSFETATLYLTETNQYRELTHLKLTFHKSKDRDCVFHLTNRLAHVKLYSLSLEHELCRVDAHRRHWAHLFQELHNKASRIIHDLKTSHAAKVAEYEEKQKKLVAETNTKVAEATVAATSALEETRKKVLEEMSTADATIAQLRTRIRDLEEHIHDLLRGKSVALDNVNRLETESRGASERVSALTAELTQLRAERDTLSQALQRIQEVEKQSASEAAEYKAKATMTDEQIKEQVQSAIEKAQASLREREKKLKAALASSDEEIEKGNKIIAKLQSAVRKERERAEGLSTTKSEIENTNAMLQKREAELLVEINKMKEIVADLSQTRDIQQARITALEKRLTQTTIESVIGGGQVIKTWQGARPPGDVVLRPTTCPASTNIGNCGKRATSIDGRPTSSDGRFPTSSDGRLPTSSDGRLPTSSDGRLPTSNDKPVSVLRPVGPVAGPMPSKRPERKRSISPISGGLIDRKSQDVLYIKSNRKRSTSSSSHKYSGVCVESVELLVPENVAGDEEVNLKPPTRTGEFVCDDGGTLSFGR